MHGALASEVKGEKNPQLSFKFMVFLSVFLNSAFLNSYKDIYMIREKK